MFLRKIKILPCGQIPSQSLKERPLNNIHTHCSCAFIIDIEQTIGLFLSTEAYLQPSRTSTMKLFCENSQLLSTVTYFSTKAPS